MFGPFNRYHNFCSRTEFQARPLHRVPCNILYPLYAKRAAEGMQVGWLWRFTVVILSPDKISNKWATWLNDPKGLSPRAGRRFWVRLGSSNSNSGLGATSSNSRRSSVRIGKWSRVEGGVPRPSRSNRRGVVYFDIKINMLQPCGSTVFKNPARQYW